MTEPLVAPRRSRSAGTIVLAALLAGGLCVSGLPVSAAAAPGGADVVLTAKALQGQARQPDPRARIPRLRPPRRMVRGRRGAHPHVRRPGTQRPSSRRPRRRVTKPVAKKAAAAKPKAEKPLPPEEKKGHPPELPSFAHVIGSIVPDTAVGRFLRSFSFDKPHPLRPILGGVIVIFFLILLSQMAARRSLLPGRLQAGVELVVEAVDNLITNVMGPKYGRVYLPFLGALFVYILSMNLLGIIPLGISPTSSYYTTASLAVATFAVVQYTAFTKHGFLGVLYHWAGEPKDVTGWLVAIILFPLHMVEDLVIKPGSLALRLFGNIFGEDVLLGSMLALGISMLAFTGLPVGIPLHLPFLFVAVLASTIQALVFTLLSAIYIYLVLPHHDDEAEVVVTPSEAEAIEGGKENNSASAQSGA